MTEVTENLARSRLRLILLDFEGFHRAGLRHQAADALTRLQTIEMQETPLEEDVSVLEITEEQLKGRAPKQTRKVGIVSPVIKV